LWALEARAARVRRERPITVLALAVLVGTLALGVRAATTLLARMLRPVLAAVAVAGLVIPLAWVAVAAVVSAYLVRAQRVLAVTLAVLAALAVLAVRTVLQQPQMQERRVAHMVAVVAALTMTAMRVPLVLSEQCVSSTPVRRAHSHRLIQETYKWNTQN
jgi:hypothetical protein